ncbi:MAG: isoprenyl transferase [Phycisphaeraceae bacterium]|nr:isoprenyl transferase [Phycisphaeraceae bacterium]
MPTSAPSAPASQLTGDPARQRVALTDADRQALARIRAVNPKADPLGVAPDVPPSRIPRHIAVIMDGNGRWAAQRGLDRSAGHRAGAKAVQAALEACNTLGVEVLTLYSFSVENWKRPRAEVDALMRLYLEYMALERDRLVEHNLRFKQIGRREGLPPAVLEALEKTLDATKDCTGPILNLAVNYGSRAEIADAAREIARKAAAGELDPESVDETVFERHLETAGLPDPDLLIRTAGEMRISNYLLWQISYAELHVTQTLWPDFDQASMIDAVRDYASRSRRFGGLDHAHAPDAPDAPGNAPTPPAPTTH